MKLTVTAVSDENYIKDYHIAQDDYIKELEIFSGKAAAVCYLKDSYFGSNADDVSKARNRFDRVIKTGHHSISDHSFISVLFENLPKMTAMILNSLGFYNTSEKSGRYTIMSSGEQAGTDNEKLYYKWLNKFKELIAKNDPNLAEREPKLLEKLSMENARYMLSMFAPNTTMMFTTSLRMWSYLVCWCRYYIETADESTEFNKKLKKCVNDLYLLILTNKCFSEKIEDIKHRKFYFLANQVGYPIESAQEIYTDSYLIKYKASFADLAQEQRHRTLKYFMCFDGSEKLDFYVPEVIKAAGTEEDILEWIDDLNSISDTFPTATLVDVVETGFISDFILKCDERLCGRVMLETFNTIKTNLLRFAKSLDKSPFMLSELERHIKDGKIIMKCGNQKCKEPCYWGAAKALSRNV